jgi:hypothetical protein
MEMMVRPATSAPRTERSLWLLSLSAVQRFGRVFGNCLILVT